MKRILLLSLSFLLCLSFSACSGEKNVDEPIGNSGEINQNQASNPQKNETAELATEQVEPTEAIVTEIATLEVPATGFAVVETLQAGIPPEYQLKQNALPGWTEPLPTSEVPVDLIFFNPYANMPGGVTESVDLPDIQTLVSIEEIETFFGKKIVDTEEENNEVARVKQTTFTFEPAGDDEPYLSLGISAFNSAEDAEMLIYIFGAEELQDPIGVKTTMYNFFGITGIYVVTEKNIVISVSGDYLDNQQDQLLAFAKLIFQRYSELP